MADKIAWSDFEQRSWPEGETSRMKFIIEPPGMGSRRVGVGMPVRGIKLQLLFQFVQQLQRLTGA